MCCYRLGNQVLWMIVLVISANVQHNIRDINFISRAYEDLIRKMQYNYSKGSGITTSKKSNKCICVIKKGKLLLPF